MTKEKGLVSNPQKDALISNKTLKSFASAMSDLSLDGVPEDRKQEAIMDHFFKIMADSIHDKAVANEIKGSRVLKKGFKR